MFLVSLAEVLVWTATYLTVNAIQGFEPAFYFSMVRFLGDNQEKTKKWNHNIAPVFLDVTLVIG